MKILKPRKLKKGGTIGLLSVSGEVKELSQLENAKNYFENQGFKVKISKNSEKKHNYLCGTDEERLKALQDFFLDEEISAIIATRGGYGSLRLVNKIDYEIIKKNPKIFAGHSDITALSLMFFKKTGLVTFSSPMACADFSQKPDSFTEKAFWDVFWGEQKVFPLENPKIHKQGTATGRLWGGNLATIASLAGLDFVPDENFVLFIEDVAEPAYKIDRMLTQLLNIEKFKKNLSAIVPGDFTGLDSQEYFENIFFEFKKDIPIISGLKIGHEKEKITLPAGVKCRICTQKPELEILEDYFEG